MRTVDTNICVKKEYCEYEGKWGKKIEFKVFDALKSP
jgi:hypothetical protein